MTLYRYDGKVLIRGGALAAASPCCCGGACCKCLEFIGLGMQPHDHTGPTLGRTSGSAATLAGAQAGYAQAEQIANDWLAVVAQHGYTCGQLDPGWVETQPDEFGLYNWYGPEPKVVCCGALDTENQVFLDEWDTNLPPCVPASGRECVTNRTQEQCEQWCGTYHDGSTCNPSPCPVVYPCCCAGGSQVQFENQEDCEACVTTHTCIEQIPKENPEDPCPEGWVPAVFGPWCTRTTVVASCDECEGQCITTTEGTCGTYHADCNLSIRYRAVLNYVLASEPWQECFAQPYVVVGPNGTCVAPCGEGDMGYFTDYEECMAAVNAALAVPPVDDLCAWSPSGTIFCQAFCIDDNPLP